MCDLRDGFRLCTCPEDSPGPPDWTLSRQDTSRSPSHRRGRAMRPKYTSSAEAVAEALNARDCFDFEYTPLEGDVLTLSQPGGGRPLRFRYTDAWALDYSTSLTGWRSQMVALNRGCIEQP